LAVLDTILATNTYVAGPDISIADLSIWPGLSMFELIGHDFATKHRNIGRWYAAIGARPVVTAGNAAFVGFREFKRAESKRAETKTKPTLCNETLKRELNAVIETWVKKYAAKDFAGLAALYTVDGQLLPPNMPAANGHEAIARTMEGPSKMGVASISVELFEAHHMDVDSAWERGRWRFFTAEGAQIDAGKYIVIWRRIGAQWFIHRDLFNSDGKQADIATEIKAANDNWMARFAAKDTEGLGNCYTENARLMPHGHEMITGRAGIGAFFGGAMRAGVAAVELKFGEAQRGTHCESTAFERSAYIFKAADGSVVDVGKYVVVWKRCNGKWFLDSDIFCSDRPAA